MKCIRCQRPYEQFNPLELCTSCSEMLTWKDELKTTKGVIKVDVSDGFQYAIVQQKTDKKIRILKRSDQSWQR